MEDVDKVYEGSVIWFSNKTNFGFIAWEKNGLKQKDLFVYWSDIHMEEEGFRTLKKDQKVSFKIGQNLRSQPKAIEVKIIE